MDSVPSTDPEHRLSRRSLTRQRKSQSGLEPTADGHPIIHSRFFSSETGVGIGMRSASRRAHTAGALMPSRLGPHHLAEGCEFVFTRALMNCGLCGLNESELLRIKATWEDGASPSPHFGRCFNKRAVDGHRGSSSLTRQNLLCEETRLGECSSSITNMRFCATAPGSQPSPKRLIVQQPKDKGSSPSAPPEQCVEVWVVMQITNCTGHRGKREGNGSLSARHAEGGEGRTVQLSVSVHPTPWTSALQLSRASNCGDLIGARRGDGGITAALIQPHTGGVTFLCTRLRFASALHLVTVTGENTTHYYNQDGEEKCRLLKYSLSLLTSDGTKEQTQNAAQGEERRFHTGTVTRPHSARRNFRPHIWESNSTEQNGGPTPSVPNTAHQHANPPRFITCASPSGSLSSHRPVCLVGFGQGFLLTEEERRQGEGERRRLLSCLKKGEVHLPTRTFREQNTEFSRPNLNIKTLCPSDHRCEDSHRVERERLSSLASGRKSTGPSFRIKVGRRRRQRREGGDRGGKEETEEGKEETEEGKERKRVFALSGSREGGEREDGCSGSLGWGRRGLSRLAKLFLTTSGPTGRQAGRLPPQTSNASNAKSSNLRCLHVDLRGVHAAPPPGTPGHPHCNSQHAPPQPTDRTGDCQSPLTCDVLLRQEMGQHQTNHF
ncbi:unnamed protein product [Pleuronectes platessa]|uniref:Uncharacterized protein n=1 Tax=Pleuronectes platessa TaxID=8262 RepID=A0A9N7Z8C5_PLEPL|nr:unnamed protein product [Pleuronectes platessa]